MISVWADIVVVRNARVNATARGLAIFFTIGQIALDSCHIVLSQAERAVLVQAEFLHMGAQCQAKTVTLFTLMVLRVKIWSACQL
jgi:hypothetical protein